MNKLELVDHVATEAELTKVSAAAALEAVLDGIIKTLKKGEEVRLVGFGTFSVRERAAGKGRNPATGKEIKIAASRNARFKPGAALKDEPQQEGGQEIDRSGYARAVCGSAWLLWPSRRLRASVYLCLASLSRACYPDAAGRGGRRRRGG